MFPMLALEKQGARGGHGVDGVDGVDTKDTTGGWHRHNGHCCLPTQKITIDTGTFNVQP